MNQTRPLAEIGRLLARGGGITCFPSEYQEGQWYMAVSWPVDPEDDDEGEYASLTLRVDRLDDVGDVLRDTINRAFDDYRATLVGQEREALR